MEYHIIKTGNDNGPGTAERPFATIGAAAALAEPGDTVTVHAGTYREWVNPANGGAEGAPITYRSAGDGEAVITGAEVVDGWEDLGDGVWKATVPNSLFGDYNPYRDQLYGDWYFVRDKNLHTGEVYLDGKSLYEAQSLEEVKHPAVLEEATYPEDSKRVWYAQAGDSVTVIYANFGGEDPNGGRAEINVRPYVFWPEETGKGYITVRGFTLRQAATQWAPPTALQQGLIGPHWSKGWIIEDNIISESKCVGISLGKEISTGHNEWTHLKYKQGTQREREVIFRAARGDWNKEHVGGHIVRNNVIFHCEQAGIVGHLGCVFSQIHNNHIYDINHKRLIQGAEIGGIKLHAAIDTWIGDNVIHGCYRGIWLDWQAQGTRVYRNLLYDNSSEDLFVEVSHGPYVVDHNIMLSPMSFKNMSQGGAFVHNLFAGKFAVKSEHSRFTPYHFPHETEIAGVMTLMGGDDRFYNNIFLRDPADPDGKPALCSFFSGAPVADGVPAWATYMSTPVGLSCYDAYLSPEEEKPWENPVFPPPQEEPSLPVYIGHNLYLNGAKPWAKEKTAATAAGSCLTVTLDRETCSAVVSIGDPAALREAAAPLVTTDRLGAGFQAEMPYEQPDGSPYRFDRDFCGNARPDDKAVPGPFQGDARADFRIAYRRKEQ